LRVSPAREVDRLVRLAKECGWDTCVLTTPLARRFVDVEELAALTGHPLRSDYKHPDEPDVLPLADALIVAPATVNTINKWAAGICDTLALGILVEGIASACLSWRFHRRTGHTPHTLRSWRTSLAFARGGGHGHLGNGRLPGA
jgi:hypothetical protein